MEYANVMQKPVIEKVVVNICVGESGEKLMKAEKLLEKITGMKPVRTVSTHKIPAWGLRKGEAIGCKVTLRGAKADEVLKNLLFAKDDKVSESSFDAHGNMSFGIREYIDIKGMKYDPEIGIFGLDVCVTIKRPGFRVTRRKKKKSRIPKSSYITREEAISLMKEKFGVEIE
ncbi:MAG: 50S ribosomal protein L5 [Candidatus Altiarchaeota archaeon]